ncbi:hypothetical protein C8Q70DRAFT_933927 [Cubamyces menziesii]|uniref:Uncharacterized protein n=1 Tax=Trametes cubensis TaxID=1111947 RepID=A0AAD7XFS6_9APHY|nr:hypothetical protein C8Q70DRAFT_933927 [Cubamyces menziesii]KAJ8501713.1 hypothetical protein ONZ51_g483 [Trametes cubensis]
MSSQTSSSGVLAKFFVVLFALFSVFFQLAAAVPVAEMEKRDIFDPTVLYPHAGTVWYRGQTHNVTWDVSDPPVNITNKIGKIMLRKGLIPTPLILADGFDILLGRIEVTVPWVLTGDDYSIVLYGDSGNFGQQFTINQ